MLAALQLLDYGVPEANIMGIRYGFKGFYDRKHKPVTLTRRWVGLHHLGWGLWASSRAAFLPQAGRALTLASGQVHASDLICWCAVACMPKLSRFLMLTLRSMVEEIHLQGGTILVMASSTAACIELPCSYGHCFLCAAAWWRRSTWRAAPSWAPRAACPTCPKL